MSRNTENIATVIAVKPINYKQEFVAAASTYLTMSYIFLLNPSLLAQAGINPSAAFFATVMTAFFSTMAMGLYAKLPYAVAPVPTVTTFFVFYVCQEMGFHFEEALTAVFISGFLSVIATFFSIREQLIKNMPGGLKVAIMFAIGGFLIANGLKLGDIIPYSHNGIIWTQLSLDRLLTTSASITIIGFMIASLFNTRFFKFRAGPLFAIIVSTIVASKLGLELKKPPFILGDAVSSIWRIKFAVSFEPGRLASFWFATFVFFVVDFYGSIGKFVGLYELTKHVITDNEDKMIGRALYVDSWGTVGGSLLGTSSAAVFISSAVGIMSGGTSGVTAVFCALLILLSVIVLPLVGSIPIVVSAGILIYIGTILMPWSQLHALRKSRQGGIHLAIASLAGLVSIVTYGIDKGLFVAFAAYSVMLLFEKGTKQDGASIYLFLTTILLGISVVVQSVLIHA